MKHKWTVDRQATYPDGHSQHVGKNDQSIDVIEVCARCGLYRNGQTKQGPDGYYFRREYWMEEENTYAPGEPHIVSYGRYGEIGAGRRCRDRGAD